MLHHLIVKHMLIFDLNSSVQEYNVHQNNNILHKNHNDNNNNIHDNNSNKVWKGWGFPTSFLSPQPKEGEGFWR